MKHGRIPKSLLTGLVPSLIPLAAWAQSARDAVDELMEMEGLPDDLEAPWREFLEGWAAFGNWHFMLQELLSLVLAVGLASTIAYHPRLRPRTIDPAAWDRPRAMVVYALVGAVVAELVLFNPPMAFVVFGIGGLMRFRSVIGTPQDTGRAILAAVIGLACGLKLFPLAVLATLFMWVGTWVFKSHSSVRLEIRKLEPGSVAEAISAWRQALEGRGCRVPQQRTIPGKGRIDMLVLVPAQLDIEELQMSLDLPSELRGTASWSLD